MKYLEYLFPVISSIITFFLLSALNIAKYIKFIPEDQQKDFNLTFYTAIISILFILSRDFICFILKKLNTTKIILIVHKRNETADKKHTPEIIFSNQVAEFTLAFEIKGNYRKLENMKLRIQLPKWADFQPKSNVIKNGDFYEIKIKDLMAYSNTGKPVDFKRDLEVIISEIPDGDTKEAVITPILKDDCNSWRKISPCKFESNSFRIKVV